MRFIKMHGTGNDYVFVNCFEESIPPNTASLASAVSDRHRGIGADGLILICPSEIADAQMRMFNADGSEAEMCGNGIRCLAKLVYEQGIVRQETLRIETGRGVLAVELACAGNTVEHIRVNMGAPVLVHDAIPTKLAGDPPIDAPIDVAGRRFAVTCLSMGNPHCVLFTRNMTDALVQQVGPALEQHPAFPNRTNVEFVQVISPNHFTVRVWERGCGETQACGTGTCAAVVAGVLTGHGKRDVQADLLGGRLHVEWSPSDDLFLTGPATEVFTGVWPD